MADEAAKQNETSHATAWLLVVTFGFLWLYPVLVMRGMSLDGVVYATISRNMALGLGDPWHLVFTATHHSFRDSPPLGFYLQSLVFRALGDHWWVERLYSVATILPTAGVLVLIWRHLLARLPAGRTYGWLPILFWVAMPAFPWIYRNNLLENTLTIFSTLAVYASLRALGDTRRWLAWTALAAVSIMAAVLSKGPVGLFPAVTPAVAWLTLRAQPARKTLVVQLSLLACLAVLTGLLLAQSEPREFLTEYFDKQIVQSLQGRRENVRSPIGRWSLLWTLAVHDLLPCVALAGGCVLWARRRKGGGEGAGQVLHWQDASGTGASGTRGSSKPGEAGAIDRARRGALWFCLVTGASASLPIMISPKQSAYYAAPSWPFYTMAIALWCLPAVQLLSSRADARASWPRTAWWLRSGALATIAITVAVSPFWAGSPHRDRQIIRDVEQIAALVEPHATLVIPTEMENEFSMQAYLYRWHFISLKVTDAVAPGAFHLEFAGSQRTLPPEFEPAEAELGLYRLYKPSRIAALGDEGSASR